jgi:hypothetical protein
MCGLMYRITFVRTVFHSKNIIKPIWTYGIEIWGCASKSSQAVLQKAQPKILRMITNAPRYVTNLTLHEDLQIPYVREVLFEK